MWPACCTIADQRNQRLRTVDATGVISNVDGDGANDSGDNQLSFPGAVAICQSGTVYIADQNNDRIQVILASGNIVTITGNAFPDSMPMACPAPPPNSFYPAPWGWASKGTVYFADKGHRRVRALHLDSMVVTLAQTPGSDLAWTPLATASR
jgi:hypothetical protein